MFGSYVSKTAVPRITRNGRLRESFISNAEGVTRPLTSQWLTGSNVCVRSPGYRKEDQHEWVQRQKSEIPRSFGYVDLRSFYYELFFLSKIQIGYVAKYHTDINRLG